MAPCSIRSNADLGSCCSHYYLIIIITIIIYWLPDLKSQWTGLVLSTAGFRISNDIFPTMSYSLASAFLSVGFFHTPECGREKDIALGLHSALLASQWKDSLSQISAQKFLGCHWPPGVHILEPIPMAR